MWAAVRAWLKAGGALPGRPRARAELTQVEYGFNARDELQLERKEDMKARGLASPTSPTHWRSPSPTRWRRGASVPLEGAVGWWSMSMMCWGG